MVPVGQFRVLWGRGARFLFYRVNEEQVYWEGIFATEAGGKDPEGERKAAVAARFAEWEAPVQTIIEATDGDTITRMDIFDRPPIKHWGEGRVTLLGDAAHPMTNALGQGANQAIEDSVVLARYLGSSADVPSGLRAYEKERRGAHQPLRADLVEPRPDREWEHPAAVHARDMGLRLAFSTILLKAQRKDMSYSFY